MAEDKQILSFNCGDQVFGLEISYLREIIENQTLTQIPLMPEHIRGVLNLRGNVVPVIDLKARLWATPTRVSKLSCILVVEFHGASTETLGLLVDSVNEVLRVPADDVEHTPELGARIRTDFMDGIAKVNDEFIILLKADMVLNLDELAQVHETLKLQGKDVMEELPPVDDMPHPEPNPEMDSSPASESAPSSSSNSSA
ncbi:MAG: chemotaxis protein CheW [Leptospiraceae bacterium]|nr:chemotaxis protein CheW [Leptospiraceae bacterium]